MSSETSPSLTDGLKLAADYCEFHKARGYDNIIDGTSKLFRESAAALERLEKREKILRDALTGLSNGGYMNCHCIGVAGKALTEADAI